MNPAAGRSTAFLFSTLLLALGMLAAPASAADLVKVHLPSRGPEGMPFLIANELKFYEQEGIKFDGRFMQTGIGVMATVAGDLDATQILGLSLRGAIQNGAEVKIVMIFNKIPSYGLLAGKHIKSVADLKGKKVGSSSSGASASEALLLTLKENGLDPQKDVTVFYMGEGATRLQALLSGAVDASVLNQPFDLMAEEQGYQPLPFATKAGMLEGGVSVGTKFMTERPEVLRRFLKATWRGLRYFKTDREGSISLMAKIMEVEPAMAAKSYEHSVVRFTDYGHESEEFLDNVLTFEFGKADAEMKKKAFDLSIVRSFTAP